jgi:hypothetical protein
LAIMRCGASAEAIATTPSARGPTRSASARTGPVSTFEMVLRWRGRPGRRRSRSAAEDRSSASSRSCTAPGVMESCRQNPGAAIPAAMGEAGPSARFDRDRRGAGRRDRRGDQRDDRLSHILASGFAEPAPCHLRIGAAQEGGGSAATLRSSAEDVHVETGA